MKVYIRHLTGRHMATIEDGACVINVELHADRTSDADSLRRTASEARAKAARELKRAERIERAAEQLSKGE